MESNLSNSFDLNKAFINSNYNSSLQLFNFTNLEKEYKHSNSFTGKKSSNFSENNSTEQSNKTSKSKKFKQNSLRKDLFGNIIAKGGKHKVSFKDDIRGNYLVEMTLIDTKQNSLRSKYYKKQTALIEARDKDEIICSGLCNIF